jgi:hypothetical protein
MQRIGCNVLKPSGQDKADISLLIHDINTSYELICDFSVKSYIGAMPTLLNASESTNFVYEVSNISDDQIEHFNGIESKEKIKDRMRYLNDIGARVNFIDLNQTAQGGETFKNNLMFIDTRMPEILGWFVKASYDEDIKDCKQLVRVLEQFNPLGYSLQLRGKIYGYKIKKVLSNIATSMIPAKPWNGKESANGGCIIVRKDGSVLTYYLYNRDMFEDYLLNNTKLERGSTRRHKYGSIYADGVRNFLKLNLQIRFNDRV